jgi:hypothetical protein
VYLKLAGIAIKLCEEGQWGEISCQSFSGLSGSYETTLFVVILSIGMLIISLGIIAIRIVTAVAAPTIRVVSSGIEPNLDLPVNINFHCFLSHAWGTGQDQTHTLARQLQLVLPHARIWLDVDNLDDVGKLEQSVQESAVFIIFLSRGYFKSANCRRELYTALAESKPIVVVREADEAKGGADIEDFKEECRTECVETAPSAYPAFAGPAEVLERLFGEEPVVWVRVHDFQIESLKLITLRVLKHLPFYLNKPEELSKGLKVAGEIGPMGFTSPVKVLVCSDNEGAFPVAEEVIAASKENPSAVSISVHDANHVLGENGTEETDQTVMLLYLNKNAFQGNGGNMSTLVCRAIDLKVPLALVHEQDTSKGGCSFRYFFSQTPDILLREPYKLFDTVAVPLYPSPEHRLISLRQVLRNMMAKELSTQHASWTNCWSCMSTQDRQTSSVAPTPSQTSPDEQDAAAGQEQTTTTRMSVTKFLGMQKEKRLNEQGNAASRNLAFTIREVSQMPLSRQVNPPRVLYLLLMIDIDHRICSCRVSLGSESTTMRK